MATTTQHFLKPELSHEVWIVRNMKTREEVKMNLINNGLVASEDEVEDGIELIENIETYLDALMQRIERYNKSYSGMTVQLSGDWDTKRVWLFEEEIFPDESLKLKNHSPDGFAWGYAGSGPSQLALAVCLAIMGGDKALRVYQDFKLKHIAGLPQTDFELDITIDID